MWERVWASCACEAGRVTVTYTVGEALRPLSFYDGRDRISRGIQVCWAAAAGRLPPTGTSLSLQAASALLVALVA